MFGQVSKRLQEEHLRMAAIGEEAQFKSVKAVRFMGVLDT
jgi:hypothetical protein